MSLTVVKGVHTSGNPPGGNTLASSIGIGQVILAFATGGGLPGSATVSDNVNTGNYAVLAEFVAQNMVIYWKVANAAGTPTVSISSPGGFTDFWAMGVTGFVGTPTSDASIQAQATGTSTTPTMTPLATSFANEIALMALGTAYTQSVTATNWSNGTTGSNAGYNCLYNIQATAASVAFSGSWGTSQAWALQSAGIYDLVSAMSLTAAVGTFSLTGEAAGLAVNTLPAAFGTFSLSGEGANLASTGVPLVMLASPGVFSYSGASSLTNYGLDPAVGIFNLTGLPATFGGSGVGLNLPAQQGGFSFQGQPAALVFAGNSGGSINALQGGFALTGGNASFTVSNLPPSSSGVLGRPGGRTIFSTKKTSEQVDFIWDFVSSLGPGETILQAVLSASTYMGNDTTPASILGGPAVVSGTQVYQLILGGLVGQIYGVTCTITTSLGQTLAMSAYLAIEPNLP